MSDTIPDDRLAMQTHCPECGYEHPLPAVPPISQGGCVCANCGMASTRLAEPEYRAKLAETREGR